MASITLANLRRRVLERADMVFTNFISIAELNDIINNQAAELHDLIVSRYEDHYITSATVTVDATGLYTLPANIYKLRGVDKDDGSGTYVGVPMFSWESRNSRGWGGSDVSYRVVGGQVQFTPLNQAPGSYKIWYIPQYTDLVANTDLLVVPENLYEFVIAGAAAVCLAKEESDPNVQIGLKNAVRTRVINMVNQDATKNEVMRHVPRSWDNGDDWDWY